MTWAQELMLSLLGALVATSSACALLDSVLQRQRKRVKPM